MLCTDCHFFHNVLPTSRTPKSCAELGEQPNNPICDSFRPRGQVPNLPLAPTEVQLDPDKPIDFEYSKEFLRLYGEQLQIERDLHETTEKIQLEFFKDQAPATIDKAFERYAQKLADLRLLHLLCGLFECDVYRDSIMAAEIERQFGVKPPAETVAQIQKASKEIAHARVLRVPNGQDRTPVGRTSSRSAARRARDKSVPPVVVPPRAAPKPRPER